jgi:hypothetical protein
MTEDIKYQEHPTEGVQANPKVLSDLLEADDLLAAEILTLIGSVEHYRNDRQRSTKQFALGLEAGEDQNLFMRLLDTLIRFLSRMIEDVANGTAGISLNLVKIINRAEQINTESRANHRVNKEGKFKIDTRLQNLSINFRIINDPQRLMMYLKSVDQMVRKYYRWQDDELLKLIPAIMTIRPTEPNALDTLVNLLSNVSPVGFAKVNGFNDQGSRFMGPHMLGNQQLIVLNKNPEGEQFEQLIGQEFLLQPSDAEPKSPPEYVEFDVFARSIEQSILRQVIATATDLSTRIGVMARGRRSTRVGDLIKYLDAIRKDVANGVYEGADLQAATNYILLLEAFNNWLVNPYLSLLALMTRNMSAILNVCDANN